MAFFTHCESSISSCKSVSKIIKKPPARVASLLRASAGRQAASLKTCVIRPIRGSDKHCLGQQQVFGGGYLEVAVVALYQVHGVQVVYHTGIVGEGG